MLTEPEHMERLWELTHYALDGFRQMGCEIGHTSTAISLATGLQKGRDVLGGTENIVAIVGDGSLSGGDSLSRGGYSVRNARPGSTGNPRTGSTGTRRRLRRIV